MKLKQSNIIAPSLLSADFTQLAEQINVTEQAGCNWFHCDIMDGEFVPNITFGPFIVSSVRKCTSGIVDAHLMIVKPERFIDDFRKAGADIITVHQETCPHLHRTIQQISATGAATGVSLNPSTPVTSIYDVLETIDLLLIMSVNPGFGGQSFIPGALRKIEMAAKLREQHGLGYKIQVDGGINKDTILDVKNAGCDIFVAGSAVYNPLGIINSISTLKTIIN